MGPDDDAEDLPPRPPPPRTERPWRHPSELDERALAAPSIESKRPNLWIVITATALIGTVVAVVMGGLLRELGPSGTDGVGNEAATSAATEPEPGPESENASESASDSTVVAGAGVQDGRTLGTLATALSQPGSDGQPWLGIEGSDVDEGVLVTGVAAAGPAAIAGVRPGDVIVAAEREAVATMEELRALIARFEPGSVFVVDVVRSQLRIRLMAVLGVRH